MYLFSPRLVFIHDFVFVDNKERPNVKYSGFYFVLTWFQRETLILGIVKILISSIFEILVCDVTKVVFP